MKLIVSAILLAIAAFASGQQLTEAQLDAYLRPCIVNGVRCPPDGSMSYDKIVENMETTKMAVRMFNNGELPAECECNDSKERCNRRCMYAMMKLLIVDLKMGPPQKRLFGWQG